jgi:hypothetical protein
VAQKISRWTQIIEAMDEMRGRSRASVSDHARYFGDRAAVMCDRFQKLRHRRLAFALDDAVNGALTVL